LECYGRKFYGNAQTFENQYKQLEVSIDEIAERISKLGGKIGTMAEFARLVYKNHRIVIQIARNGLQNY
jgi:DNA-binding ferritin-like protein